MHSKILTTRRVNHTNIILTSYQLNIFGNARTITHKAINETLKIQKKTFDFRFHLTF